MACGEVIHGGNQRLHYRKPPRWCKPPRIVTFFRCLTGAFASKALAYVVPGSARANSLGAVQGSRFDQGGDGWLGRGKHRPDQGGGTRYRRRPDRVSAGLVDGPPVAYGAPVRLGR